MRRLYLAGGGDKEQSLELDNACRKDLKDRGSHILYIPIALKHSDKYDTCDEWFKQIFSPYWYNIDILWSPSDKISLDNYDLIYIGGGNTYSLIHDLREHELVEPLKNYVKAGNHIYGGSAGAIILGKNIGTCGLGFDVDDANHDDITNLDGLNLSIGYDIRTHYSQEHREAVTEHIAQTGNPVICCPEESGIRLKGNEATIIGQKPVILRHGDYGITLPPNTTMELQTTDYL